MSTQFAIPIDPYRLRPRSRGFELDNRSLGRSMVARAVPRVPLPAASQPPAHPGLHHVVPIGTIWHLLCKTTGPLSNKNRPGSVAAIEISTSHLSTKNAEPVNRRPRHSDPRGDLEERMRNQTSRVQKKIRSSELPIRLVAASSHRTNRLLPGVRKSRAYLSG